MGLHLEFVLEGDVCLSQFTPAEHHVGYDGVTHGGILYAVLDDVMANWLFLRGERAYTARCEVRYRLPLEVGTTVRLEGRLVRRRRRLVQLEGRAMRESDGATVAECASTFMLVEPNSDGVRPNAR